jgi:hypothetical protein
MKNIKSFKDWSMNEEFFGFGEDKQEVDPKTKSKFLPNMTFEDLAKKYDVTPEYISEFEDYLTNNLEMGNLGGSSKISEEDYHFHLTENFPETHEDDDSTRHHQSDI